MTPVLSSLDDVQAVAVFADALESRGDPRGALMHLQLAREERPRDARLAEAEARHLALHGKALLGALHTASSMTVLEWRRGFLQTLSLSSRASEPYGRRTRVPIQPRSRLPRLVRELQHLPVASRLEALTLSMPASSFCLEHLGEALDEALALRLPSLARLQVDVLVHRFDEFDEVRPGHVRAFRGGLRLDVDAALRGRLERAGLIDRAPRTEQPEAARLRARSG